MPLDLRLQLHLIFFYCTRILTNLLWGPTIFGPALFTRWSPKAQAEEGYGPGTVMQVQNSIGIQPRTIQPLACPKSPRKKGQKWYRNNLGKNLKYLCQ